MSEEIALNFPKLPNLVGKSKISLLIAVLMAALLSACSSVSSTPPEVTNLKVQIDTDFSGSIEEWQVASPVKLTWSIKHSDEASKENKDPKKPENYRIKLISKNGKLPQPAYALSENVDSIVWSFSTTPTGQGPATVEYWQTESGERILDDADDGEVYIENSSDSRSIELISMEGRENWIYPLSLLATAVSGQILVFQIELIEFEKDSKVEKIVSSSTVEWVRPALKSVPEKPKMYVKWQGGEYPNNTCGQVFHKQKFGFDSIPLRFSYENNLGDSFEGSVTFSNWVSSGAAGATGYACPDRPGKQIRFNVSLANSLGKADASISTISIPEKSFRPEPSSRERIVGCEQALQISELTAGSGNCGRLRVVVFQSDLDTGSCKFLANWNEAGGGEKIGIFDYCGTYLQGSIKEDRTYNIYVKVVGPTTYKTRLGAMRTVLQFEVIG